MNKSIILARVDVGNYVLTEMAVKELKWVTLKLKQQEYINLSTHACPAILEPGYSTPLFVHSSTSPKFPSVGKIVILEKTTLKDKEVEILWVTMEEFDDMLSKMKEMPQYRLIEPGHEDPKKRLAWKGRSLKMLRRFTSSPMFSVDFRQGILLRQFILQKKDDKKWKSMNPIDVFLSILLKSVKANN